MHFSPCSQWCARKLAQGVSERPLALRGGVQLSCNVMQCSQCIRDTSINYVQYQIGTFLSLPIGHVQHNIVITLIYRGRFGHWTGVVILFDDDSQKYSQEMKIQHFSNSDDSSVMTHTNCQDLRLLHPVQSKGRFLSESVTNFLNCQTNMPNHYLELGI